MPIWLELKVTHSFCFANKIPDNVTATNTERGNCKTISLKIGPWIIFHQIKSINSMCTDRRPFREKRHSLHPTSLVMISLAFNVRKKCFHTLFKEKIRTLGSFYSESAMRFSNLQTKYSKSLSWAWNLNKLFTVFGGKFQFQCQDSDLE